MIFPWSWPVYKRKEENITWLRWERVVAPELKRPWENLLQALTKLPASKAD